MDELRVAHRQYRISATMTSRWQEETYCTSFTRSRVVAGFATLYTLISVALHPQILQYLVTGESAASWLWPAVVRLALFAASVAILIFGALTYRKRPSVLQLDHRHKLAVWRERMLMTVWQT